MGLLFGVFHLVAVYAAAALFQGGSGEYALFLALVDFPLFFLVKAFSPDAHFFVAGKEEIIRFYATYGTIMYVSAGLLIGYGIDKLRRRIRSRSSSSRP